MPGKRSGTRSSSDRLVYTTDKGRVCGNCLREQASCVCPAQARSGSHSDASADGVVRLHQERKGRKGKGVTLVRGLDLPEQQMLALAKRLKAACGVGGTVKAGVIELQTTEREKIKLRLEAEGFTVKLAGGSGGSHPQ